MLKMPRKKKQNSMIAATDRQTRSKSPESEVGSLTKKAPEIEPSQDPTQRATQKATRDATEDIQKVTEEACTKGKRVTAATFTEEQEMKLLDFLKDNELLFFFNEHLMDYNK